MINNIIHNISSLYPTKNISSNIPFFPKKNIVSIISSMWVSNTISGWWLSHPSEQCARQLSWWNSQSMESHKIHVPNHQPAIRTVITKYLCECLTLHLIDVSNHQPDIHQLGLCSTDPKQSPHHAPGFRTRSPTRHPSPKNWSISRVSSWVSAVP